jgi:hypothetical protein
MTYKMVTLFLALVGVACCGGQTVKEDTVPFLGMVVIIGNEPFTAPALQTPDGVIYRLSCVKDVEVQLREAQGKRVRLECGRVDRTAKELHVTQVHVLVNDQEKGTP